MLERKAGSIIQCGREISREELDEIQETVRLFPGLSRSELVATICEHLEWITASGGYKTDACLKLLSRYTEGDTDTKRQDCEQKAFKRLASILANFLLFFHILVFTLAVRY